MRATNLRCEHREDVAFIDGSVPRLGWQLAAEGRDRRQSGYRILVSTRPEDLQKEAGSLWDSGRVPSSDTVDVVYRGQPLPAASEVFWSVQVYDETGAASAWAEPAKFRTALESWSALWISCDRSEDMVEIDPAVMEDDDAMLVDAKSAPFLRRAFNLSEPVERARLYVTARGLVEMQINGVRVGDAVLAPGWTDYRKRIEYAAYEVTDLLTQGDNVLGAILGDGWYAGFVGCDQKHLGALYGREPELLCELHVEFANGGRQLICSDDSWRSTAKTPICYGDLLRGERHDARIDLDGWSEIEFDDSAWGHVLANPLDDVLIVPETSQPIRVTQELSPVNVCERPSGGYVCDFGQNMVGWARLRAEGAAGTRIQLRFGEILSDDGSVYQGNLSTARPIDTFVLRGEGIETFEPHFTFHGFRYVEVLGLPEKPDESSIAGCVVHSDTPSTSSFSSSSQLVNQLYSNIRWSQRGNFLSVPTDCPQRGERLGWLADAQVFLPTASLNADVAAFMTKWGDDLLDAQSANGSYSDVAPKVVMLGDGAPAWADAGVIVPWLLYKRYGDLRVVERHWPSMERYLGHLLSQNPDLIWKRRRNADYGDWLSVGEDAPKELLATAYWANDARLMARMAHALGKPERRESYERLAAGISTAFNTAYVEDDALIQGDTQTGYLLALAFDLLPEKLRPRAAERLVANIERHGWHLTTGFIGVGLLCPVLTQTGHADVAHRLLLQETYPSWGYCIRRGATTIWERWDAFTEEGGLQSELMNSFNHYSFGSIGSWLIESVVGIRDDKAGAPYEHVIVEPVPGELTTASGSYRSVRGEILSDWTRDGERFQLAVTIPPNLTATIVIPAIGEALTESDRDAADAPGVHAVSRDSEAWRVEVGSGSYRLESS